MNTSKTQDLKVFRMNTYNKTGEGVEELTVISVDPDFRGSVLSLCGEGRIHGRKIWQQLGQPSNL